MRLKKYKKLELMKKPQVYLNLFFNMLFVSFLSFALVGCSKSSDDDTEIIEEVYEEKEEEEEEGEESIICSDGILYSEKDGIIRVEAESVIAENDWVRSSTISGFGGIGYLLWSKQNNFSSPGDGIIRYSIKISNPGTYQFVWRSRITEGTGNTDHNDNWLRIPTASDFYAEKNNGDVVYPRGSGKTPFPEGAGRNGWFKVYMNTVGRWFWYSKTSDNDPHDIFARFDTAGTYDIEISGRSVSHAIDQFVLFKTDKNLQIAQNAALSEIVCK